ncbi:MAG: HAMP domain-containing protein [Deltaproteobacteria bacterium]|nr:HAMP domain-containing protein [Deltaproteobacteria bacterium]
MPRSISGRIFGGFLVLMLAFGGVMGFAIYRMQAVREQLALINRSYLRLTLLLGELHVTQGNLLTTVAERAAGGGISDFVQRQVELARQYRLNRVRAARQLVHRTLAAQAGHRDVQVLRRIETSLRELEQAFAGHEGRFDRLFGAQGGEGWQLRQVGEALLGQERKLGSRIWRLRYLLRGEVEAAALEVEADQRATVWAGSALVLLVLLVSLAVTLRARRTLSPLRTLVEGTKRIGSGDYAGRVNVPSDDELGVLAAEFNHMASAVEEREQRLIRSERMAAAGLLASHITHEVRNPLSSISLNTEMLEEELTAFAPDASQEARALCGAIRKEVDRLTGITEEYLAFARLPKPNLETENVNEILGSLLSFMSGELAGRGVKLEYAPGGVPTIQADENQLRQAFLNLVRNAGEAMAATGGVLRVTTAAEEGAVEVRVADTGPGIDGVHLGRVFEPFFSTKEGGTGLGLALTQQIVQEHGGGIAVESTPGTGTTFTVRLPVSGGRDRVGEV